MRRVIMPALLAGFIAAALFSSRPAEPPAALAADGDEVERFSRETAASADAFWAEHFRSLGLTYARPRVLFARQGMAERGACEEDEPSVDHSYCAADSTVTLDIDSDGDDSFAVEIERNGPLAIVYTIGHEWAHHVQHTLDLGGLDDAPATVAFELQADCLGGLFVRAYAGAGEQIDRGQLAGAIASARESGDAEDIPGHSRTHGTAAEREQAFLRGYNADSPAVCGLGR
jgi:uncharacterized protein